MVDFVAMAITTDAIAPFPASFVIFQLKSNSNATPVLSC
jgi:hypothetical protein